VRLAVAPFVVYHPLLGLYTHAVSCHLPAAAAKDAVILPESQPSDNCALSLAILLVAFCPTQFKLWYNIFLHRFVI
jgi:hypothetical protein